MTRAKTASTPSWVRNLRTLMDKEGLNPRSLSLKAGLNATAVRDMLEGRSRFPRYDTVKALAAALGTTPARLMSKDSESDDAAAQTEALGHDLELLTEVITRLQEVTRELNHELTPQDFAAMTAALYRRMQGSEERKRGSLRPHIHDLLDYEKLRARRGRR